ncbi:hypothetical protein [Arthrobacter sp. Alg241-R88]|uniref:hypothetical protein n=1 Tax=Arthrobacter sp. Alg241-R88 TaxID=2305984 RepID=UPI0013D1D13F|nr:hypothetical protein [Arthrobacter sp. Alg241-R88]
MSEKNTEETGPVPAMAVTQQGSTFAERAKARAKQVEADEVEDKAVSSEKSSTKRTAKKS